MIFRQVICLFLALFNVRYHATYASKETKTLNLGARWFSSHVLQLVRAVKPNLLYGNKEVIQDGMDSKILRNTSFTGLVNLLNVRSILSQGCTKALDDLFSDLIFKHDYTKIEIMLDADGRPGSGIFEGNFNWLGTYRECKEAHFAHYCASKVNIMNYTQPVTIGLCVPKDCTSNDVLTVWKAVASVTKRIAKSPIMQIHNNSNFLPVYCDEPQKYSTGNIIAFCIVGFFGMLVVLSTIIDYVKCCTPKTLVVSKAKTFMPTISSDDDLIQTFPVNENQPFLAHNDVKQSHCGVYQDALLSFSFRKNASQILSTDIQSSAISSLNGIRTVSMFWVMLGHTFFFALYAPSDNPREGFHVIRRLSFQAIANAYFSVDTFFLLSGLLVSYLSLKRLDKCYGESFFGYFGKKFLPQFYLHRFLRLTPVYMFVIYFYIYIFPFCGDGPLWFQKAKGDDIKNCKKYWWTNLLYINNFYPQNMYSECIGWAWYLANDMQFYIISPIIILTMHILRLPGTITVNCLICLASFVVTAVIIGTNNLNALLTGDFQEAAGSQAQEFADLIYSKPYSRIPPYIVGLTLGFLLYHKKQPQKLMRTLLGCFGWVFAIGIALSATYGPYTAFRSGGRPFTLIENILYGTFSRFSWSLCVAWVIYACHFGMGGFVNSLLSWKAFIPLSRLTYTAYLVHPIVIQVFYSSFETPLHFSDISMAYYFTSFIMMTYASAFVLAVCIEFPISNLEKLLFRF